jgi:cyclophilin family peptidyl-prolyl cis-trans isomerase
MRLLLIPVLFAGSALAQTPIFSGADSALVGRVLLAEDRRDSTDTALRLATAHADARIRVLAERAMGRIRDPQYAARTMLPPVAAPPVWLEPQWKGRYRALSARSTCAELGAAIGEQFWPMVQRAATLAMPRCIADEAVLRWMRGMFVSITPDQPLTRRDVRWSGLGGAIAIEFWAHEPGNTWHRRHVGHALPQIRRAVARAARTRADTATLITLSRDTDPNVREAALDGLRSVAGHSADSIYLRAIDAPEPQVVRAAAIALKGSPNGTAAPRALAAWERWVAKHNASARDARVALLEVAGRTAADDRPPAINVTLPPDAVALALGAELHIRVTLDSASSGGHFDVRLRGDVAPMMAARIAQLVRTGYYDGLTWHRVEHDFVIQGGSPTANEYDGFAEFLRDELGTIAHPRGTVGMSTRGHDTGDAQWFVNLRDNARLLQDYTVFAEVVAGMDVVDGIFEGDRIATMRIITGR